MKKWEYTNQDDVVDDDMIPSMRSYLDEQLPDTFTSLVMDQLNHTELLPYSGTRLSDLSGIRRSRRMRLGLKWVSATAVSAATVFLLFASSASNPFPSHSLIPQQTYSEMVVNLPSYSNDWPDIGLLEAQELGVIQLPNIQVSDQGYTLSLQAVVADPTRMVLTIRITDNTGQPAEMAMNLFNYEQLHIMNEDGNEIGKLQSVRSLDNSAGSKNIAQEYLILTYVFLNENVGKPILIQGDIHELIKGQDKGDVLTGDWSFSYRADMTKTWKLSVTSNLVDSYTTPEGLLIEMKQLIRTPAGVQLRFNTSFSGDAAARTPLELRNTLGIIYHFEDENGNELTKVDTDDIATSNSYIMNVKEGKQQWTHNFTSLPYDTMKVRFVLDGYRIPIKSNDSITFRSDELKEQPVTFNEQGDKLDIHDIKITEIPDQPGISAWMTVSGEFTNNFSKDSWIAIDQDKKVYDVIFRGVSRLGKTVTIDEPNGQTSPSYLIAKGMKSLPDEISLIRIMTDKIYTDVDWSFELPRIDRNAALKHIHVPTYEESID